MYYILGYRVRNTEGNLIRWDNCYIDGETFQDCLFNFVQYEQIALEKTVTIDKHNINLHATNNYIYEITLTKEGMK